MNSNFKSQLWQPYARATQFENSFAKFEPSGKQTWFGFYTTPFPTEIFFVVAI